MAARLPAASCGPPERLGAFLCAGGWLRRALRARRGARADADDAADDADGCPAPWWGAANTNEADSERWYEGAAYRTECVGSRCAPDPTPDT